MVRPGGAAEESVALEDDPREVRHPATLTTNKLRKTSKLGLRSDRTCLASIAAQMTCTETCRLLPSMTKRSSSTRLLPCRDYLVVRIGHSQKFISTANSKIQGAAVAVFLPTVKLSLPLKSLTSSFETNTNVSYVTLVRMPVVDQEAATRLV
jgi:hypothetical protein